MVKENLSSAEEDIYDDNDSSVTRTESKFKRIFKDAGLVIVKQVVQKGFPLHLGLFKVKAFALRPEAWSASK